MQKFSKKLFEVAAIPLFQDNYAYAVFGQRSRESCYLIDPADHEAISRFLESFPQTKVSHILYTHKHYDHIGKPEKLVNTLLNANRIKVDADIIASKIDGAFIPMVNRRLFDREQPVTEEEYFEKVQEPKDGDIVEVSAIFVPCHTAGHVIYRFVGEGEDNIVSAEEQNLQVNVQGYDVFSVDECIFSGDTIFIGGCGRFMEGNAKQMLGNLDRISRLSNKSLKIFCSHEYTLSNFLWSSQVERNNIALKDKLKFAQERAAEKKPTIPSTLSDEIATNVFMRCHTEEIQKLFNGLSAVEIMETLRAMKNGNIVEIPSL